MACVCSSIISRLDRIISLSLSVASGILRDFVGRQSSGIRNDLEHLQNTQNQREDCKIRSRSKSSEKTDPRQMMTHLSTNVPCHLLT
jgi:hypothetical protein